MRTVMCTVALLKTRLCIVQVEPSSSRRNNAACLDRKVYSTKVGPITVWKPVALAREAF